MKNFDLNKPGSVNKFSKISKTNYGFGTRRGDKLVSQEEIFEFIKENPEMSEPEIIYHLYRYTRRGQEYEKRYADGFRRAIRKYNIQRKPGVNPLTGKKAYVYFTKEFMNKTINDFKEKHCDNKNKIEKPSPKSLLKNFDIIEYQNGELFLVNVDGGVTIGLDKSGGFDYLFYLNENLEYKNNNSWSVKAIYRTEPNLLQYIHEDKDFLLKQCDLVWKKYTPKTYEYTMDEVKELLGVDKRDNLIIK